MRQPTQPQPQNTTTIFFNFAPIENRSPKVQDQEAPKIIAYRAKYTQIYQILIDINLSAIAPIILTGYEAAL